MLSRSPLAVAGEAVAFFLFATGFHLALRDRRQPEVVRQPAQLRHHVAVRRFARSVELDNLAVQCAEHAERRQARFGQQLVRAENGRETLPLLLRVDVRQPVGRQWRRVDQRQLNTGWFDAVRPRSAGDDLRLCALRGRGMSSFPEQNSAAKTYFPELTV